MRKFSLVLLFILFNSLYGIEIGDNIPEGFVADSAYPLLLGGDPMSPYFYHYGDIEIDGIKYSLCEEDGEVIYISTNDPSFVHNKGYSYGVTTYSEFLDYELHMTIDFVFYIILEDGWHIAFNPKDLNNPKLDGDEPISLFYKTSF